MLNKTTLDVIAIMEVLSEREGGYPVAVIKRRAGISEAMGYKLMRYLLKAGLVTSTRGASGGYKIARPANEITLAEIIKAINPQKIDPSIVSDKCPGTKLFCNRFASTVQDFVESCTLDQLAG